LPLCDDLEVDEHADDDAQTRDISGDDPAFPIPNASRVVTLIAEINILEIEIINIKIRISCK